MLRLAAFYYNGNDKNGFLCAGILVSTKIVATAANCFQAKRENSARRAEDSTFYLGKHNLETFAGESNYVVSGVRQIFIHPSWNVNEDSYTGDVALAVLLRAIQFSKFIKPICLWTSTSSFDDIVGKTGVVAGEYLIILQFAG